MGYKEDQRLPNDLLEDREEDPPPGYAPPLPPRDTGHLPPPQPPSQPHIRDQSARQSLYPWASSDPRNASTESLHPQQSIGSRRTLLLIYIHGFLGDETTFRSFPAHVHNLTTQLLNDSHVVHTKIYPKYKPRRAIQIARDDFSEWLRPHESPNTDIILLGHSMGGILSADIGLKRASPLTDSPLLHRILGLMNFDAPFLGMHPGVVVSGISSLFRPGEVAPIPRQEALDSASNVMLPMPNEELSLGQSPNNGSMLQRQHFEGDRSQSNMSYFPQNISDSSSLNRQSSSATGETTSQLSPLSVPVGDPNYNPRFENDVVIPVRKGWENAMHFISKHAGGLTQATKTYVTSHFEFGGTMADYRTLRDRYKKVRALEDVNDTSNTQGLARPARRVRFVNYYTASSGRLPPAKTPMTTSSTSMVSRENDEILEKEVHRLRIDGDAGSNRSGSQSPRISVEDPEGNVTAQSNDEDAPVDQGGAVYPPISGSHLDELDPKAMGDQEEHFQEKRDSAKEMSLSGNFQTNTQVSSSTDRDETLPPVPPEPSPPLPFDDSHYANKDIQKLAEKDYARKLKAYKQAVKDREKAISDRQKMLDKRGKQAKKDRDKALKADRKAAEKVAKEKAKEEAKREASAAKGAKSTLVAEVEEEGEADNAAKEKAKQQPPKKRDRKFCITPSKGPNGERDPTWIRVYMEGVDEVGAHCGIFFDEKPHYVKFVNDVAAKLQEWVERDNLVRERKRQDVQRVS